MGANIFLKIEQLGISKVDKINNVILYRFFDIGFATFSIALFMPIMLIIGINKAEFTKRFHLFQTETLGVGWKTF